MEKSVLLSVLLVSFCLAIAQPSPVSKSEWRTDIGGFITKCADQRNYCVSREPPASASRRSIDAEDYSDTVRFDEESDTFKEAPRGNASASTFPAFCQCDDKCSMYGDCCLDANESPKSLDNINGPWTCLPLSMNEFNRLLVKEKASMFMIGRCPKGTDEILASKCLQKESPLYEYSYMMDIPVFSHKSRQMYGNIFCAQCNGDSDNLETWNVTIQYNDESAGHNLHQLLSSGEAKYLPKERRWLVSGEIPSEYAIVIEDFEEPIQFIQSIGGRHCIQAIDDCAPDWQHKKDVIDKCKQFAFYVETTGGELVFKNPHCARCNNVPDSEIHCYGTSGTSFRAFARPTHYDYSFSLLMNFNWKRQCTDKEVYNPIHETCQPFFCGKGYVEQNGTCTRRQDNATQHSRANFETYLNSSCPRLNLSRGVDFEYLENGSIALIESQIVLDPFEYEPSEDNSTVQICADERDFFGYSSAQRIVSDVCLSISVACLAVHIVVFGALPTMRNLPGKNLLSLSCSLFFAHLLFLLGIDARQTIGHGACVAVGALIHWFYLAAFFWMNVMGFEIWKTFASTTAMISHHNSFMSGRRNSTFLLYSAYAWITPTLIVALGIVLDYTHLAGTYAPRYGSHFCWIGNRSGLAVFFVLPMAILLLANCVFFGITTWTILQHRKSSKPSKLQSQDSQDSTLDHSPRKDKNSRIQFIQNSAKKAIKLQIRFMLYVKLALIMGLGWTFGFVAGLADRPGLWYPFILLNALQGAFIFIAFTCKQKTIDTLRQSITNARHRFVSKTTSNIRLTNSAVQTLSFTPATTSTSLN